LRSAAEAEVARAFFNAERSVERCARLRAFAARDFRMFFSPEAIFGTTNPVKNSY
jgi:hypothetical protein